MRVSHDNARKKFRASVVLLQWAFGSDAGLRVWVLLRRPGAKYGLERGHCCAGLGSDADLRVGTVAQAWGQIRACAWALLRRPGVRCGLARGHCCAGLWPNTGLSVVTVAQAWGRMRACAWALLLGLGIRCGLECDNNRCQNLGLSVVIVDQTWGQMQACAWAQLSRPGVRCGLAHGLQLVTLWARCGLAREN
jgi:hypothetical protein